ncbi:[histone H3]-lysine(4) N-trimethyltransferase [Malassezia sp. CBS 17886]|nr:[histone H3]-lysine(4) N-trimethyltransferase [Malassezia sp. CBS 17886]
MLTGERAAREDRGDRAAWNTRGVGDSPGGAADARGGRTDGWRVVTESSRAGPHRPGPPPPVPAALRQPTPAPRTPSDAGAVAVPLPDELPADEHVKNYQTLSDPNLAPGAAPPPEMRRRYGGVARAAVTDPRMRAPAKPRPTARRPRRHLDVVMYRQYDQYSVGPPPPCEVVITELSPLTTPAAVLQQCRVFGPVDTSELKVDPQTGQSIGIMWVRFAEGPHGTCQDAAECAARAASALQGMRIGAGNVHVVLDSNRAAYVKLYRAALAKRYGRGGRRNAPEWDRRGDGRDSALSRTDGPGARHAAAPNAVATRPSTPPRPPPRLPRASSPVRTWRADSADDAHRATTSRAVYYGGRDARGAPAGRGALDGRPRPAADRGREEAGPQHAPGPPRGPPPAAPARRTPWTLRELVDTAVMQLMDELEAMFRRDVKTRTVTPMVTQFLRADGEGGRLLSAHKAAAAARVERAREMPELPAVRKLGAIPKVAGAEGAARTPRAKAKAGPKRPDMETDSAYATPSSPTPPPRLPAAIDPAAAGVAEDAEDLYLVQKILALDLGGMPLPGAPGDVGDELTHASGCARAEGFYRIPAGSKAMHLPERNRAVDDEMQHSASATASARNNRADSRRLVLDIEQHKKETLTDTDVLKFNQLQSRKKPLRFAKSPIHDWGLYAKERIPAGDMVIEYVGEIVRQQVADHREKMYECAGNFSTYLFRVDDDVVVDATRKGNIARLMNHCCTPNCNARILTVNGEKRIVIFAKDPILPGQEASEGDEDAIPCLCGSPACRRWL